MSIEKYLDYAHLQYYHQKLNLEFDSFAISEDDITDVFNKATEPSKTYIDKTMTIPSNGYLRIRFGGYYTGGSDQSAVIPVEWRINNLTFQSNTDYAYYKVMNTRNYLIADGWYENNMIADTQVNGLSIELVYNDDNNVRQYYSTIGRMPSNVSTKFLNSSYSIWPGMTLPGRIYLNSNVWNFITMDIPTGTAKTYALNYHTDSTNLDEYYDDDPYYDPYTTLVENNTTGDFFDSDEFQITIIHNTIYDYSVIFHWMCVEQNA